MVITKIMKKIMNLLHAAFYLFNVIP